MAIKSYLAYPRSGKLTELIRELSVIPGCEANAAENRDVVILVTETASQEDDEKLEARLHRIPALATLTLVYGCRVPELLGPK